MRYKKYRQKQGFRVFCYCERHEYLKYPDIAGANYL